MSMTETLPPQGISFKPGAPRNGNVYMFNIISGDSLPDQLKQLLLNGGLNFKQDINAANNPGNTGIEDPEPNQPVGGSEAVVAVTDEITPQPESPENVGSTSNTVIEEEIITIAPAIVPSKPLEPLSTQVLKSIIYGGLTEVVASLGVVTSAASTHTATGKIVALSLASLVTGVFVFGYKFAELWTKEQETGAIDTKVDDQIDEYEELLGDRQNYRLHCTISVLSFLFFGLVPPLVYGFTFRKPEEKDMKIVAVTGASILCIVLLAMGKAHIQRSKNCLEYFKTIGNHVVDGIGASVLTTISGGAIEKFIEQIGWFDPNRISSLFLPSDMASANRTWGFF